MAWTLDSVLRAQQGDFEIGREPELRNELPPSGHISGYLVSHTATGIYVGPGIAFFRGNLIMKRSTTRLGSDAWRSTKVANSVNYVYLMSSGEMFISTASPQFNSDGFALEHPTTRAILLGLVRLDEDAEVSSSASTPQGRLNGAEFEDDAIEKLLERVTTTLVIPVGAEIQGDIYVNHNAEVSGDLWVGGAVEISGIDGGVVAP